MDAHRFASASSATPVEVIDRNEIYEHAHFIHELSFHMIATGNYNTLLRLSHCSSRSNDEVFVSAGFSEIRKKSVAC